MRNDYGWVSADEPFTARTSQDPMKSNPLSSRTPSPPLKDDMRRNTTPDGEGYTTPRKSHAREMYVDGSEDERIVPHGEQREPRTRSNGPDGQREPPQSSFFLQLRCTLVRVLLLMWRNRVVVILETVIPILLVLATVGLWKAFSDANNAAADYFDASTPAVYEDVVQQLRSGMCHNADVGVIAGTPACDFSGTTALYCPTGRGVPAGLCYPHALVSAVMSIGKLFQGNTSLVPTFDDIVALHWCNLDSEYVTRTSGDDVSALTSGGMLYFAPNTPAVQGLVQHLSTTTTFFNAVNGGVFDSADAALQHVKKLTYLDAPTWAIVQVDSMSTSSFDVTLRLNSTAVPSASDAVEPFYLGGLVDSGNTPYLLSGFTTLQTAVYDYYMAKVLGAPTASLSLSYTPMPTRAYKDQGFMQNGRSFAPFIITIGFLYPMSQRAKRIVMEKESHIREALLIMGLSEIVMYCAWFLVYTVQAVIISLVIALIMVTTYLPDTGFFVVFFMFLFFALAAVSLSFAIAALFSRARMAAMMAPLIYYVMALPLFIVPSASSSTQTGLLVLPPSALSVGINLLFQHEMTGGASASTLTASSDDPNLLVVYIVLFFDILIYLVVMMYLNLAIVSGGGAFFFVAWIKRCVGHGEEESTEDGRAEKGVFEDEQRSAGVPTVTLTGLRKTFSSGRGPFVAVNNLHWSMREGEISVLLGHNGAGKTTTMNMITGMLRADSGDCVIYGKSVRDDLTGARQYIGFCPQHNVLWPELTCREHLWYFASIKGLSGAACDEAVERMLKTVGLQEKANSFIPTLSGGQMRKLSLAIAFVGGSPLVLLDEPTAGMDVVARRQTWELLRQMTADHTILLTTHFMDEADLLGDSIGIMSQGRMQCSGSNMFLKSKLGVGYVLTMSVRMHAPRGPLESLVRRYVPDMEDKLSGAGEAAYRLPMHAKSAFPKLLTAVEDASASLGIEAYSLSATTLEDVFLSIAGGSAEHGGEEGDASAAAANGEVNRAAASSAVWNVEIVQGRSELLWMQFRAMMVKRLCNLRRDRRTQFFQVVCPIVCVIIAMLLTKVTSSTPSAFALSSSKYHGTVEVPLAQCSGVLKASALGSNVQPLEWSGITDGAAFSSRLMDTYNSHSKARYSGLSCGSTGTTNAAFYNSSAEHSVGIATADFYNALLQQVLPGTPRMQTTSQTLPLTSEQVKANKAITLSNMALLIMVPLSMVPSTYISWVVRERQCKARHLQNVSGLNFYVYWLSNLLFDFCTYLVTMFLIIIVLLIFDCTALVGSSTIGATIVLMLLYGMASILMAYMLSFAFEDANRAQSLMTLLNFFLGFILTIVVQVLASISSTESAARTISYFFSVVPTFSLSNGLRLMSTLHMAQVYGYTTSVWSMDVVGWSCVYLGIEIPIFLVVAFFLDHPGRKQRMQRMFNGNAEPEAIADEDPDVVAERAAVQHSAERADDLVRVQALRKEYEDGKVAVRNVTFGIRPGEVFGFLGTNGAGKTTTIAILCQELYPTSGFASICGHDIVNDSQAALRCIGYCPQFDACLQLLTVREHLNLYAGVRGIAPSSLDGAVEGLMQMFELKPYEDTQSDQLSGGNRRKLSVAISLLGGPRVVLLDEPSAGMDPVARRGLWTAIESMADNCAVVLTTHHLEEVDALAHRVAIMVDGTLRCIGDKTYLKQKFGSGTEVVVRLRQDEQRFAESEKRVAATEAFFQRTFPESRLVEARYDRLTFEMPTSVKLSAVFTQLEENSESMGFVDYSVSQTSLEQVFLHISEDAARKAEEEDHQKQLRERKLAQQRRCFSCLRKKPATDDEDEE